jgi:PAS domain S-box-containing protein
MLFAILVVGALTGWWLVVQADRDMRKELLQQAHLLAEAVNPLRIKALSGTEADLDSPIYQRLKAQCTAIKQLHKHCRFTYLVGRKPNGSLFIFLDSESPSSSDYSPPGQIYSEASKSFYEVFAHRSAGTEGPITDRWGTWVTALVPIHDPTTTRSGLASPASAKAMVQDAVRFYKQHGRERLIQEVSNPHGLFHSGDLYAFVYDPSMTVLAHPTKPNLIGRNLFEEKDWAGGKYFRKEMRDLAFSKGNGWVDYEYENPSSKAIEPKTTYIERADDLIICAGAYKGTGSVLALQGIDVAAHDWNWRLVCAAAPAGLLTLALIILMGISSFLLGRQTTAAPHPPAWPNYVKPGLLAATGLILTLFAVWLAHTTEARSRRDSFAQLATGQTSRIADPLRNLSFTELEGLARFLECATPITPHSFCHYAKFLNKNPMVHAWEWLPAVPADDQGPFQEALHRAGFPKFEIWQKGPADNRIPASGRATLYPVAGVMPREGNEQILGFDSGSDPARREAMETAARTGLSTATDLISLIQNKGTHKGLAIYRPIFLAEDPHRLLGFAVAELRVDNIILLTGTHHSLFELFMLGSNTPPKLLTSSFSTHAPSDPALAVSRPIFAFGKTFVLTTYADQDFLTLHPQRAGWLTAIAGSLLTAILTLIYRMTLRRRETLERLVTKRTLALQESEQSYHNQFANNSAVMLLSDPSTRLIIDANNAAVDFYGYSREQLLTMHISDINPLPLPEIEKAIAAVTFDKGCRYQFQHRLADGSIRDVEVSASRIQFGERTVIHSIIHDITERRRSEEALALAHTELEQRVAARTEELRQANEMLRADIIQIKQAEAREDELRTKLERAARMESLGMLAGGIAHDLNNILCPLVAIPTLVSDYIVKHGNPNDPDYTDALEDLNTIKISSQRAAGVVSDLMALGRRGQFQQAPVDLARVVEQTLESKQIKLIHVTRPNVMITKRLAGEPTWCLGSESRLIRVLANLVGNAAEAIQTQGQVTISTGHQTLLETYNGYEPVPAGAYVTIEVTDTGCGIDAKTMTRMFEPFFSTKAPSERSGSGLGLSVVHGLVKDHAGFLDVKSCPGKSTTFTIYLPAAPAGPPPVDLDNAPLPRGSERILVVDDEPTTQFATQRQLTTLGYTVTLASSGETALAHFAAAHRAGLPSPFALAIVDIIMTGIDGLATCQKILSQYPNLKIIVASGHAPGGYEEQMKALGADWLAKPYTTAQLATAVRSKLDRSRPE